MVKKRDLPPLGAVVTASDAKSVHIRWKRRTLDVSKPDFEAFKDMIIEAARDIRNNP